MPTTIASGPDWATVMTAFGTVGAVIAAVGIAIWSSLATKSQLRKQRDEAQKLEQRSQAAAVEVLAFRTKPGENVNSDPRGPSGLPVVIVVNRAKYAITDLDVRLSPDGRHVIPFSSDRPSMRQNAIEPANLPPHWTEDARGNLGEVYSDTIAPGAAIRFKGAPMLVSVLETSYPIARWRDHWGDCWEYNKGSVYKSTPQADWLPQSPGATGED
ncbi:MAG: hypothetical protein ACLPKI_28020 [Streptosporangiaceae bacterium]